jgi:uncharacterized membrane protein
MKFVVAYGLALVVFVLIDLVWLGVVAKDFYRRALGDLIADPINLKAAVAFYLIYVVGLVIFGISPALRSGIWTDALLYGALFGFFCYATYDLTNLATLKNWPLQLSLVDLAWGTTLTGITATVAYFGARGF